MSLVAMLLGLASLTAGCVGTSSPAPSASAGTTGNTVASSGAECDYILTDQPAARPVTVPMSSGVPNTGTVGYTMILNNKPVGLTLTRATAPCAVNSFASLAAQGFFDNTSCHRITTLTSFMLQCGDPSGTKGFGGPGYRFAEEVTGDETYPAGTLAMGKAQSPATSGSQFFIVYAASDFPPDYTVFGKVDAAGLKVVKAIADGGTNGAYGDGEPLLPANISSVKPN